jgi:transposase
MAYKSAPQDQILLLPGNLGDLVGEKEMCRVISCFVDALPFSAVEAKFPHEGGAPCFHPRMMLKVILFAYAQGLYSCRDIARAIERDVQFMWLACMERPCFNTVNRFRGTYLREVLPGAFAGLAQMLLKHGYIREEEYFLDGTSVRANAGRHSHVWRKNTERYKARVHERARQIIEEAERVNAREQADAAGPVPQAPSPSQIAEAARSLAAAPASAGPAREGAGEATSSGAIEEKARELRARAGEGARKAGAALEKEAAKMRKYEEQEALLAGRNSYSKTDPDATFMRAKDDTLMPAYNIQAGVQEGFVTGLSLSQNPNDATALVAHMEQRKAAGLEPPALVMADSVYGTEENYAHLQGEQIEAYLKYPSFHRESTGRLKPFEKASFRYDEEADVFVCPKGRRVVRVGEKQETTKSGYVKKEGIYECEECSGCPSREDCTKGKGNRQVRHSIALGRYQSEARLRLESEKGKALRRRRGHECETPFAHVKHNLGFHRFHLRGLSKVAGECFLLFMGYNFKRLLERIESQKKPWNPRGNPLKIAPESLKFVRENLKIARNALARLAASAFGEILRPQRFQQAKPLCWK